MSADLDRDITAALEAEVAGIRAGDDLWDRIRASAEAPAATPARARRPNPRLRLLMAAAAGLAVALATGAVAVLALNAGDDPSLMTGNDSETGAPATETTAPPSTDTTVPPATAPATSAPETRFVPPPLPGGPRGAPAQAVAALEDGRLVRLDLATQTIVGEIDRLGEFAAGPVLPADGSGNYVGSVDVAPDGDTVWVATIGQPLLGAVKRASLANWAPLSTQGPVTDGRVAAVSPDGRFVVTDPHDIVVYDAADGHEVYRLPFEQMPWVSGLSWSPDGTRLAVRHSAEASADPTFTIAMLRWDGSTLSVDPSFADTYGSGVYWDRSGDPVVLDRGDVRTFSTTADGRWTTFIAGGGGLHLVDRDGNDTLLFPDLRFIAADLIG
jgi:hypothetical protein